MYRQQDFPEPNTDHIKYIIRALKKTRAYKVYFFGGEPLLRADIFELIAFTRRLGFQSMLDTNGVLLGPETARRLRRSGLTEIGISLDSADAEKHDAFRGLEGVYQKALDGLRECARAGLQTYVTTFANKENLQNGDLERLLSLCKTLGTKVRILSPVTAGRWLEEDQIRLDTDDVQHLRSLLEEGSVFWESVLCSSKGSPFVCFSRIKAYIYISTRGDVQPCNFIPVHFGNVYEEPVNRILRRMWQSSFFKEFDRTRNPSGCPMNDPELKSRILRAQKDGETLPVDFRLL